MVLVSDTVVFAGDWHGDTEWAVKCIKDMASMDIDTILHVGDFGFWPGNGGAKFIRKVSKACVENGVTIAVTPGNHEDWARLNEKKAKDIGDGWGAVKHMAPGIIVLPRAHLVDLEYSGGSRSLVSLGGAPSIDFDRRTKGISWWPEEMITQRDVDAVSAIGHVDIMVAHDSPTAPWATPGVEQILQIPPHKSIFSFEGLRYAREGGILMNMAYEDVMPRVFVHGHFHVSSFKMHSHGTVWSLAMQREFGNILFMDLARLSGTVNP